MAISNGNVFLAGVSGKIKNMVVKQFPGNKTVICAVPDMHDRILSEKQKESTTLMRYAIRCAQIIIRDPEKKKAACLALRVPPNKVFRALVSEFMVTKGNSTIIDKL